MKCSDCKKKIEGYDFYPSLKSDLSEEVYVCGACKEAQLNEERGRQKPQILIQWACEGGTGAGGKKNLTNEELEGKLSAGMKDDEIDQLMETKQGEAVVDKYINRKYKEGKHIEEMTGGTFNRKLPNGDLSKAYTVDHSTGAILPD